MTGSTLANHLWQSTLIAAVAWLVTLALRRERAGVRYVVWLAASLKFLVPFGLLVSAGERFAWHPRVVEASMRYVAVADIVSQPFTQTSVRVAQPLAARTMFDAIGQALPAALVAAWAVGAVALLVMWMVGWRRVAAAVRSAARVDSGPVLDILRRLERETNMKRSIALVSSRSSFEPGVFGILTPVLVWPDQISAHLSPAQIEAVIAHEITHVRRRDNLTAALHMLVQAAFWFHPAVWWIGAHLVAERERACDEAVVRQGNEPQSYAESILKVCQFYTESPLTCVAGVTGAELKKRIEYIMADAARGTLDAWKKCFLAAVALALIGVPLFAQSIGVAGRPAPVTSGESNPALDVTSVTPRFEVASIRQNRSVGGQARTRLLPGGRAEVVNLPLNILIRIAYASESIQTLDQIAGGPEWLHTDRFDIVAKAEGDPGYDDEGRPMRLAAMLRTLLAERFQLKVHTETREVPRYALIVSRNDGRLGPQLRPSSGDCYMPTAVSPPRPPPDRSRACGFRGAYGNFTATGVTMAQLAENISNYPVVGRPVVDATGLSGKYDWHLEFEPVIPGRSGTESSNAGTSSTTDLFTALTEQLGLKLQSERGPVEFIVVDHVVKPTAD